MELIGKSFKKKDDITNPGFYEKLYGPTVFAIEESKKKGVLIVRWTTREGQSVHNTFSIKEAEKNVKKGKWILQ